MHSKRHVHGSATMSILALLVLISFAVMFISTQGAAALCEGEGRFCSFKIGHGILLGLAVLGAGVTLIGAFVVYLMRKDNHRKQFEQADAVRPLSPGKYVAKCREQTLQLAEEKPYQAVWPSADVVVDGEWAEFFKNGELVWRCNSLYAAHHFDCKPA